MVQMKYTAAALIAAAAVAAPAFAFTVADESSISAREVDDLLDFLARDAASELEERELAEDVDDLLARASAHLAERGYDGDDELLTREFDEVFERDMADLAERDPMFKWLGRLTGKGKANANVDSQDMQERDLLDEEMHEARDFDDAEGLEAREFDEFDLEARDPLFGKAGRWLAKKFGHKNSEQSDDQSYDSREFDGADDLDAREFDGADDLEAREFDEFDLEARDPMFGKAGRWVAKKFGHKSSEQSDDQSYDSRELDGADDLDAREFDGADDLEAREFDEFDLEARDPMFGKAGRWIAKKFGHKSSEQSDDQSQSYDSRAYDGLLERHYDELMEREIAADPQVVERDFIDAESDLSARDLTDYSSDILERDVDEQLVAREPGIVEWFKNLFGGNKKKKEEERKKKEAEKKKKEDAEKKKKADAEQKKAAASAAAAEPEESDADLEARDFYDEFDDLD